jgi:hypothetical protein
MSIKMSAFRLCTYSNPRIHLVKIERVSTRRWHGIEKGQRRGLSRNSNHGNMLFLKCCIIIELLLTRIIKCVLSGIVQRAHTIVPY